MATLRPQAIAAIVDHVHQSAERAGGEAKVSRRRSGIRKLRVSYRDQLARAVLDLDNNASLTAMPLAPHQSDNLPSQCMMPRCNTN